MALLYIERSPRLTEHPNTQSCHDHGISKQRYQQQEGNKLLSLSYLGKSLENQAGRLSFSSQFRLTGFVKQVVLLWPQNSFCPSKVTCRLLQQRSDKSQFRFAKEDNRVIMVTRYQ